MAWALMAKVPKIVPINHQIGADVIWYGFSNLIHPFPGPALKDRCKMQGNEAWGHALFQDDMHWCSTAHGMSRARLDNQYLNRFLTHDAIKPGSANVSVP